MDRSAPKATPSSNRSAAKAKPQTQAAGLRPDQTEVFDGLLLALLARKRLLVLVGEAGSGRAAVFHQLVEQVGSDGALVLPVAASAGAQVEDLVSAAGDAALPSDSDDRDFDTLIEELEERLDLAGTGLLAVENAGVLAAPALADLIDLTRSETPSGRFLQVLLCGTPEMERTLARPGLAEAVRELGVIYRMTPGAGPSVTPTAAIPSAGPSVAPAAGPVAAPPRAAAPPRRAAEREANDWPANDWDAPDGWTIPEAGGPVADLPVKRPRRRAALAGAAITTLILLGAAGAGVTLAVPGATPERALDYARQGWQDLRSFVTERVHNPFADEPSLGSRGPDTLALARPQNPYLASLPAEAGVPVAGPSPTKADAQPPAARTVSQPAAQPSAPAQSPAQAATATASPPTTVAKLDPAPLAKPEQPPVAPVAQLPKPPVPATADPLAVEHAPPPKPRATEYRTEQSEGPTGSATLPPLVDEPAPQMAAPAMPQPAAPAASAPFSASDNGLNPRVRTLVDQARRQIAAKLLTTPPNNNAYETVSRLREIAPATPEIQELLTTMEETYRRWASLAERDGNWDEARRFYERALIVAPNTGDLRDRIKAAGEGRVLPAATASAGAVSAAPGTPPAPPATAEVRPGLDSRDGAIALMRRTDELKRALDGGADPNKRVDNGKTLLMLASEQGLTDAVRLLIDRRAKTELRTADGATAVMYAAWGGHEAVIHALAAAGAELDATNDDGKTALMAAAARGHDGVVKILVDRGVSVDRVASHGWSALMYAANNGHDRVARMLVERGANPFRMDTAGNSALTLGALQGHMQVVEALKPH
ncbi:ankyrin repeat domain-containing protein [Azospirillum brasilense]|uniref:ORC1/DEAH AAA+ ATPase domain-containing protein n=1 Tax=Azospirillum brasilense TaxID=192 RepID=A0A235H7E4_AZOBR|nr:ankyrin repeat domain-containing protein [Azospirillum brasilense]OYD81403.1 hypothetical protein CHT98_26205 [Azospirillum brasilense]